MAERKIPATDSLEMYLNDNTEIVIVQEPVYEDKQFVIIQLRDVEIVRQWLAELLLEAECQEGS